MGYTRIVSRDNLKFHNKRESFVVCFHSCLLFSDHEFLCRSGRINEWLKEKRVWKEWEREREKLTQSGGCSRGWNSYGNPRWGRTKACASSHGHQFHSCTRLSESDRAPRSYSPRTQNPTHLSLALPHFPCTSTTFTCAMNINKNEEHKLFNIGCISYFLKISRN